MHSTINCLCLALLSLNIVYAQSQKSADVAAETKMEAFSSKPGMMTKSVDFKLPGLKLFLGEPAQTRVRKVVSGDESKYFYLIEQQGKSVINTASIEYDDLLYAIKALAALKDEVQNDLASKPDYLENKFVTDDGFQFGYYVTEGKSKWYLKFEQNDADNTLFINDVQTIETSFNDAKKKIEEVKRDSNRSPLIARE